MNSFVTIYSTSPMKWHIPSNLGGKTWTILYYRESVCSLRFPHKENYWHICHHWGFPCSSVHKESACSAGDLGSIPGLGRSPGEGNGNPHYSILAWKISQTEEPGGLQSMGLQRVRHDWATNTMSSLKISTKLKWKNTECFQSIQWEQN